MRTVYMVRDILEKALAYLGRSEQLITLAMMEQAQTNSFQWIIRYLATAKGFVYFC